MGKAARFLLLLAGRFVGLLDQFSGAAAAYSLRSLSASTTNVVKVRRSSDDTEQDFTAADITDGTLLAFVNENVEKVLNGDFSNGSTNWTISNGSVTGGEYVSGTLSAYQQGIRQSLTFTGTGTLTFDLTLNSGSLRIDDGGVLKLATSSGAQSFTLTNPNKLEFNAYNLGFDGIIDNVSFIPTNVDGFVTTWYDQSGNTNNATQATAANQPKIVSSGSLITDNGKAALDFDGTNDSLAFTQITSVSGMYLTAVANFDTITGGALNYQAVTIISDENVNAIQDIAMGARQNKASIYYEDGSIGRELQSSTILINTQYLLTGFSDSNGSFIAVNGTQTTGVAGRDDYFVQTIGGEGTFSIPQMDGTIQEVIVYTSDQSAKRTGIEANINDYYNIYP